MIVEICFQWFYWGNRVNWFQICYCQHVVNICCCLRINSRQISELSEKRAFNRYIGVIGCADSEYINANIRLGYNGSSL